MKTILSDMKTFYQKTELSKICVVMSVVSHGQEHLVHALLKSLDTYLQLSQIELTIVISHNLHSNEIYNSDCFNIVNIQRLTPKGFGENHNSVFENFKSDYFFVLNPDLIFDKPFDLDCSINYLQKNNLDISSPLILNPDGKVADYKRADLTLNNFIFERILRLRISEPEWFAGMFLIFRSRAFQKLKGFDQRYFMYVEDCDICMRARKKGLSLGDLKNFSVIHFAQRDSRKKIKLSLIHTFSLIKYWIKF